MHNIVYITDENYVLPTKASINSIVQNIIDTNICVNVICVEVTEKNQQSIKNLSSKNIKVNILNFGNDYNDLGENHHYVSKAALFKFQLPEIFKNLDKILYIDGDTLLFQGFQDIFNTDIKDVFAAVVMDMCTMKLGEWHKKLNHLYYFNSGMMYLNLKKMREEKCTEKLIEYKKNDKERAFMDQNALNVIFDEKVIYLSPKYNFLDEYNRVFQKSDIKSFYNEDESELDSPVIRHMAGSFKPWKTADSDNSADFIPYVPQEDSLKVAKNYCISLKSEFEKKKDELENQVNQKFNEEENSLKILESETTQQISDMQRTSVELKSKITNLQEHIESSLAKISALEALLAHQNETIASQSQQISDLQNRLNQTYNLLINTRHRTLYGACAWLFRKVFGRN